MANYQDVNLKEQVFNIRNKGHLPGGWPKGQASRLYRLPVQRPFLPLTASLPVVRHTHQKRKSEHQCQSFVPGS